MRPIVIVSGVLGGGAALVFALAAVVAATFPTGTLVPTGWMGGGLARGPVMIGSDDVIVRGLQIEPNVDPDMDIVVPPDIASPDEVVN